MSFSDVFEVTKETLVIEVEHRLNDTELKAVLNFFNVQFYLELKQKAGNKNCVWVINNNQHDDSDIFNTLDGHKSIIDYTLIDITVNKK